MIHSEILPKNSSNAEVQQAEDNPKNNLQVPEQSNISNAINPPRVANINETVRQTAMRDLSIIDSLMNAGIINSVQGQHLMNYILTKAREVIEQQPQADARNQKGTDEKSGIEAFTEENPEFFKLNGRKQVLDYLKKSSAAVDKDELLQIAGLIEVIEQNAVEAYLQKEANEKSKKEENEAAKQRLRANAQNRTAPEKATKIFTREQIGKMSGAEFAKNERAIMEQLRKGLIR